MFTQCPKCTATFKITAEQLRQANGKVRCGKCNNIYDALSSIDDEQVPEARPEWLNDPEEERAREIEAEIAEIERTGKNLTLTPSETTADAPAEDDHPEETTVVSEDSTAIEADEVHTDTVTQFSDAVFSIEADAQPDMDNEAPEEPDSELGTASYDAALLEVHPYDPEQEAAIDIDVSDSEETPDTSNIPYTSDEEVLVAVEEDAEAGFDDDNGIVFTIEDDEPAAEAIGENTLTNEDIEEILGDSSIDDAPSFDADMLEGSVEDWEEPSSEKDEDEQDDTVVDADDGDDLEFNVPKQQWGKFFAGRYEGPVIDSVGPLDEPDYEAFETSDDETDETAIAPEENDHAQTDVADDGEADTIVNDEDDAPETSDDDSDDDSDDESGNDSDDESYDDAALDDLEDLLEEESEALQTYNDLSEELTAQDEETVEEPIIEIIEELDSTDITHEQDQEEDDSDDEIDESFDIDATSESLRKAIDTLTMEKAEWRRLLESADNDTDSIYMVEDDDDHDDHDETEYEYNPAEEAEAAETDADERDEESDDEHYEESGEDTLEDGEEPSSEEDEHDDEYASESDAEAPAMVASGFNKPTEADLSETPLWVNKADDDEKPSGTRRWISAVIFILLLFLLATQIIHYKRETLATDPAYGEMIRNLYVALDRPLFPAWDLSAYEIRGSEAISGESNIDVLDIRAQLAVNGDRPMGEPQIKVILKDRWGNPVNSWMFSADQYMRGMRPPNGLIQPGSLIPVHLSVVDPGSAAQGFQLEICLRREGGVLQCDSEG